MAINEINCNVFQDIALQCRNGIGGIQNAWIAAWENFDVTVSGGTGSNENIVLTILTGTTDLYEITPARSSSNITETQVMDTTNTVFEQVATLVYVNQAALRNFVLSIAKSTVVLIVLDRQGIFKLYGLDNGFLVATTMNTGTAEGDKNTLTITLTAKERYNALIVSASAMTAFL